ncbi:MAG: hypothetical protein MUC93_12930 [Bacteroidales bacterium]|nr:hypothetical protein [Bacteroidales bacterium]
MNKVLIYNDKTWNKNLKIIIIKSSRRNFFKTATFAGAGAMATGMLAGCTPKEQAESNLAAILDSVRKSHTQKFNMSGYAAPAIPVVRIGMIGLGDRGSGALERLSFIEGVEIRALCDKREVAVKESQKYLQSIGRPVAQELFGSEESWKKLSELPDLDLIYICTP